MFRKTKMQLAKLKIWEILQDLISSINNGKKKVDRKSLKIKRNLKDSLKCNTVDLVWILIFINKLQDDIFVIGAI